MIREMESSSKMVERRVVSVTSSNEVVETNAPDKWEYQVRLMELISRLHIWACFLNTACQDDSVISVW